MRINKLSLKASKSEFMVVGQRRKLNRVGNEVPNLVLNNEVIERVEKIKYLGTNIDESLNWEEQYKLSRTSSKGHKLLEKAERHPSSKKARTSVQSPL